MANVKKFFEGNFLKAEDCKGGELCEIMTEGVLEEIQGADGKIKSVLNYDISVDGVTKLFTPNKTNGNILIEAFGEDDKNWIGKKFTIELMPTIAFGKKRNTIVVKPLKEEKPAKK